MHPESHRLVTDTEQWLKCAYAHGVQDDDTGKSCDQIAQDYYRTSAAYNAHLAPDPMGPTSANHQAAMVTGYARALLIEGAIGRRGADPVPVLEPEGRISPRCSTPDTCERESIPAPAAANQGVRQAHEFETAGFRP